METHDLSPQQGDLHKRFRLPSHVKIDSFDGKNITTSVDTTSLWRANAVEGNGEQSAGNAYAEFAQRYLSPRETLVAVDREELGHGENGVQKLILTTDTRTVIGWKATPFADCERREDPAEHVHVLLDRLAKNVSGIVAAGDLKDVPTLALLVKQEEEKGIAAVETPVQEKIFASFENWLKQEGEPPLVMNRDLGAIGGKHVFATNELHLNPVFKGVDRVHVVAHEWAHRLFDELIDSEGKTRPSKDEMEIVAEAAAYATLGRFGSDTADRFSFQGIAIHLKALGGGPESVFKKTMPLATTIATRMIQEVESNTKPVSA